MYKAACCNLDCKAVVRTHTESESETEQTRDEKKDGRWSSCALRRAGASVVALMSSHLITFTAKWSRSRRAATEAQVRVDWGKTQPWLLACWVHTLVAFLSLITHHHFTIPPVPTTFPLHFSKFLIFFLHLLCSDMLSPPQGPSCATRFQLDRRETGMEGCRGNPGAGGKVLHLWSTDAS